MPRAIGWLALGAAVASACGGLQPGAAGPGQQVIALVNGALVDGTGAPTLPDAVVVLANGLVTAVGPRGQVSVPPGARVLDVRGGTILPGFINAHVHDAYAAANLAAWARAGVTTVRDEGVIGAPSWFPRLIAERDRAWMSAPYARLVATGSMISAPGGYGWLGVASPDDARRVAAAMLDQGADLLKVALEDGYGPRTDLPVLADDALRAVVALAHQRGRRVSAHVTEAGFLADAVAAGVDDIAHMPWDPVADSVLRTMVERGVAVTPTLTVLEAYGVLAGAQSNLRRFVAMGGRVALGNDYTDLPQNGFPHFELGMPMWEIRRMAEAGMTPMQIVVAATREAARVCGLDTELGTLEAGKRADVLVVGRDPLRDLDALTDVRYVVLQGEVIVTPPQ